MGGVSRAVFFFKKNVYYICARLWPDRINGYNKKTLFYISEILIE